jgi:hypothetical protein
MHRARNYRPAGRNGMKKAADSLINRFLIEKGYSPGTMYPVGASYHVLEVSSKRNCFPVSTSTK